MSHADLYIEEIKKGNLKPFIDHVMSQLPEDYRLSKIDAEILRKYSGEFQKVMPKVSEYVCTGNKIPSNRCNQVLSIWSHIIKGDLGEEFIRDVVRVVMDLFASEVGVTTIVTLPIQVNALMAELISEDAHGNEMRLVIDSLDRITTVMVALSAEILMHFLVEETGTPLATFMNLAKIAMQGILSK
ncbi:hypothetical protein [Vulcanisaeta thermophila]|uniref:hypothetical protein n=1 Tax=Vulcanisaeta thermophila TaxID=867917 RepID=UPI000853159D|nr:hypothetical protein [Vulcanisaeta thermophila]